MSVIRLAISENAPLAVVKLLLEKGADLHARDDSALRRLEENGHLENVALIKLNKLKNY